MQKKRKTTKPTFNIKNNFLKTVSRIPFKKVVYLSLALSAFDILVVFLLQKNLPPEVPLYYGLPEGEGQLTTAAGLAIAGVFSMSVVLINVIISTLLQSEFLQRILVLTSFAVAFMSLFTTLEIVLLVGSL
ncbi:hypothetical protein A2115_01185 [Candidatus Woesebacteria bacterium GWA1_41_8]|jgi:hypothetical protein|uniref:DUF1648 domain-containing protein n=1 Tax=Candidatus Woesebacteria bacterium GWA1_41_8 TaxID=1802471 RepID=A0A1F7WIJ8_9BACT|nr:MAG: hypothetical protein A2115_01185 [Candidatus Woesebacteria bacterium GWA1_41_8]